MRGNYYIIKCMKRQYYRALAPLYTISSSFFLFGDGKLHNMKLAIAPPYTCIHTYIVHIHVYIHTLYMHTYTVIVC